MYIVLLILYALVYVLFFLALLVILSAILSYGTLLIAWLASGVISATLRLLWKAFSSLLEPVLPSRWKKPPRAVEVESVPTPIAIPPLAPKLERSPQKSRIAQWLDSTTTSTQPHFSETVEAESSLVGKSLQNGRFQVGSIHSQNDSIITYRAHDSLQQRDVLIKELFMQTECTRRNGHVHCSQRGNFKATQTNFQAEFELLSRINCDQVVSVLDFFKENQTAYQVIEFSSDPTLRDRVKNRGSLPETEAIRVIYHVAYALQTAYINGLTHPDLNPTQVVVDDEGHVKVGGFGLSQFQALTAPSSYAALEGHSAGVQSEIYALGAMLYFMLTGKDPVSAHERSQVSSFTSHKMTMEGISSATSAAIESAMELGPQDRPQTVADFLASLGIVFDAEESAQQTFDVHAVLKRNSLISSRAETPCIKNFGLFSHCQGCHYLQMANQFIGAHFRQL